MLYKENDEKLKKYRIWNSLKKERRKTAVTREKHVSACASSSPDYAHMLSLLLSRIIYSFAQLEDI